MRITESSLGRRVQSCTPLMVARLGPVSPAELILICTRYRLPMRITGRPLGNLELFSERPTEVQPGRVNSVGLPAACMASRLPILAMERRLEARALSLERFRAQAPAPRRQQHR